MPAGRIAANDRIRLTSGRTMIERSMRHVRHSTAAFARGDMPAALEHARRAVDDDPESVAARINAAILEGPALGYERALGHLAAAEALDPRAPGVHGLRGFALLKLQRPEAALAAAERAIAVGDVSGYEIGASVLQDLGRSADAIALLDRPEVLDRSVRLRVALAVAQIEIGRRDDAVRSLRTALHVDPTYAHAWFVLADLADFDADGRDIATMGRLLEAGGTTAQERIVLAFALGKAHLARAETALAFAYFQRGNAAKRRSLAYDIAADERAMAEIAGEFCAARVTAGLAQASRSERPVFVVGMPRSGTTLVESLLASHPAVFGAGELPAMNVAATARGRIACEAWPTLAAQYLVAAGGPPDAMRVVDKMPLNFAHAGFIHMLFPNARIVHCRRNALDTGVSCFTTLFDEDGCAFSYDLTDIGRFTAAYERLMAHWRAILPADRFLEIDYEDLVADAAVHARRLTTFCGLPWDDAVLRFHESSRPVRSASRLQVRRPIYRSSVNRAAAFGSALDPLRDALKIS